MNVWENSKSRNSENTAKVQDPALDAAPTDPSSEGTTYICAGTALERPPQNLGSKNMSRRRKTWTL